MFNRTMLRSPRPPNALLTKLLRFTLLALVMAGTALADIDKSVQWTASPLVDALGQPLPPAVSYEVWLTETGRAEYLAASVNGTTYTLRAVTGVTYQVRVRGVSALGLKSPFSELSAPYTPSTATPVPPAVTSGFGSIYPNPFNARTTITYNVPDDLSSAAPLGMEIFDVRGRRLRVFDLDRSAGSHEATWDGRDDSGTPVPAGMYIARYVCGTYSARAKLTLIP